MKRAMSVFALLALVGIIPAVPARAQIGAFGATFPRREYHRETGDFRLAGEVFAPGYSDPYWGWLGVSNEELQVPNCGRAKFSFILVTDDGKPVRYGKWTDDQRIPVKEWRDLNYGPNGFELDYDIGSRPGVRTIHFAGSIKGGQRNYTKVWLLLDFTFGGRRKDRVQTEALQFLVYDLRVGRGRVDPQLLANAQESKGAGGSSLIGPVVEDEQSDTRRNDQQPDDRRPAQPEQRAEAGNICIELQGFDSWVRVEWAGAKPETRYVRGKEYFSIPQGVRSFDLYILRDERDAGIRVRNRGENKSFDAVDRLVVPVRSAR